MNNFFKNFGVFILGFITCIIITGASLFFLFSAFSSKLDISEGTYLLYDFAGQISEKPLPSDKLFDDNRKVQLYKMINALQAAKFDDKIEGILVNGDMVFLSSDHAYELSIALDDFKRSGKKVYAWTSEIRNSNYMLLASCDQIYMPDSASAVISLKGYSISVPYFKDLFDNFGISYSVVHSGNFKGTGENYIRRSMSDEMKSQYSLVLDSLYLKRLSDIAENRKIDFNKLEKLYSSGKSVFMTPEEALDLNLIDGFKTYEEVLSQLFFNSKPKLVPIVQYSMTLNKSNANDKIAVIYADGAINNYYSGEDIYGNSSIGAKTFNSDIEKIIKDNTVKGVIIRVNSPGGSALASEMILRQIVKLKEHKPVYISMGQYAASGGYYISAAADKIIASPYCITGSIGVVSIFMDLSELFNKHGIKFETIKRNRYDDIYSISRKPQSDELELMEKLSRGIYDEFTSHVKKFRDISDSRIDELADGRIWSGVQAVSNNLADETGGFQHTIQSMKDKLGLVKVQLDEYPKPLSFMERIKSGRGVSAGKILYDMTGRSREMSKLTEIYSLYLENGVKPVLYLPADLNE